MLFTILRRTNCKKTELRNQIFILKSQTGNTNLLMLVLDPNITNSWNRQITTRFFLISCIKSAKDSLTFKRTVARTFTDFIDLFSIVFLIPAPECDSALTFLCVWAVRRSSRSREKGTRGCWEPPVDPLNQRGDDKQQQHQHHQHHFSAST